MKFINWINSQEKPKEVKSKLQAFLGRSESAITSYLYGYRKVPANIAIKISDFTGGKVTKKDLDKQYESFNLNDSFAFAPTKGQRIGKPVLNISKQPTQHELDVFILNIKEVLEVEA